MNETEQAELPEITLAELDNQDFRNKTIDLIVGYINEHVTGGYYIQDNFENNDLYNFSGTYILDLYNYVKAKDREGLWEELRENFYQNCDDCDNYHRSSEISYIDSLDRSICEECRNDNYMRCENCSDYFDPDSDDWTDGDDDWCSHCTENRLSPEEREQQRVASQFPINFRKHQLHTLGSNTEGDTLKTSRVWSCEVEHYITDQQKAYESYKAMPKYFGIAHDGSLDTHGTICHGKLSGKRILRGIEVQTCLMQGKESEGIIRKVLTDFREAGHYIDSSCGLHIHLDTRDITAQAKSGIDTIKRLFAFHVVFEDIIQLFIPTGRRQNRFARMIAGAYDLTRLDNIKNIGEFQMFWYKTNDMDTAYSYARSHYQETRYYGFNMHCLFQGCNNVEIRHHSGTLSAQKILEWVNLHARVIDFCKEDTNKLKDYLKWKDLPRVLKLEKFFSLIKLEPESKTYFLNRYAKFGDESPDTEDNLDVPEKELMEVTDLISQEEKEMIKRREIDRKRREEMLASGQSMFEPFARQFDTSAFNIPEQWRDVYMGTDTGGAVRINNDNDDNL